MNRLQETLDCQGPSLAVTITDELDDQTLSNVLGTADVAEYRVDKFPYLESDYIISQARRLKKLPILATIRIGEEGGDYAGTEEERIRLFSLLMGLVDGVDVELASKSASEVIDIAHQSGKVAVVSMHDFTSTPSVGNLYDRYWQANELGADYVKFAISANTAQEFQRLAAFTISHGDENLITVAMGSYGPISRVVLPALGSRLTYAFSGNSAIAPGQMDFRETRELLYRLIPEG